jgi:hypothetical protein
LRASWRWAAVFRRRGVLRHWLLKRLPGWTEKPLEQGLRFRRGYGNG